MHRQRQNIAPLIPCFASLALAACGSSAPATTMGDGGHAGTGGSGAGTTTTGPGGTGGMDGGTSGCTLPWGGDLAEGASVTAYGDPVAVNGSSYDCPKETRTCTNGA